MPNLITIGQYDETIEIINGTKRLNPVFSALKEYYIKNAGYEVYNFIVEEDRYGKDPKIGKYSLLYLSNGLLLERNNEFLIGTIFEAIGNGGKKTQILHEKAYIYFIELCKEHNLFTDIKWKSDIITGYDFNPIWWDEIVNRFGKKAIPYIKDKYSYINIHSIVNSGFGRITVFFETDKQLYNHRQNGLCRDIIQTTANLFDNEHQGKKISNYGIAAEIIDFSSKETLDRDYNGNLYYYYK